MQQPPTPADTPLLRFLTGGLLAGAIAAVVNIAYALAYTAITGVGHPLVAPLNIAASSAAPILIGVVVWWGLNKASTKAGALMTGGALLMAVVATAFGFLQATLPDGSPKPPGFQGLVQPMHFTVPLALILVVPWWLRRSP